MSRDDDPKINPLAEDVAAASAAYLWDVLPEIMATAPEEAVRRLALHVETAIRAYLDGREKWGFRPPNEHVGTHRKHPRNGRIPQQVHRRNSWLE